MNNQKIFNKSFLFLLISNFSIFIGFEMLLPILPAYLLSLNASSIQVGLVTTLFTIGAVLIRPLVGYYLIDNQRKTLAIGASAVIMIITFVYPFLNILWLFLLSRFFHGIAWGVSTTANGTIAVDLIPKTRLGEGMGYFSISTTVGSIIAPSLGIFIYDSFSFDILIWSSVILSLTAIIALQFMHSPAPVKRQKQPFQFFNMIFEKDAWFPALLSVITTFAYGAIVTFLVLFGKQKGLEHVFLFFLINAVVSTLLRPFTGRWYDKKGPWSIIIVTAMLGFLSLIMLSYATNDLHLIIAAILFGAGYGTVSPCLQTWAVQRVSEEKSAAANATFYSSFDVGVGVSAFVLGILAEWISLEMVFRIVSLSFIVVAVLVYKDYLNEKKRYKNI
ncbi:putative transporter protein [Paenibacillus larvae subsp. larvae]|uniref:Putative transporter protein n=1 Tax=Paenibacillus larvae subsp. larvae TaxID=147375 RepID=A0A2L1TWF6_9BACL|nr:MFS transporter [Paenibacillus larvae]AQT85622.1 MFS transporter [Paenibacillus larvae subsp. pulvifaciens]AQZ47637.1 MFS transporter [Paenibacillus larvae subsp. pulvifaciens]AVF25013.1 putative transporter protein [Paenibacillus larvae subsp. larvae]AVF29776.1 putative transporter protein [Paenibacillus larvae subsp. larvae]MBH0341129.1 antibiotic resistance protein [Paenibacillus larvae]